MPALGRRRRVGPAFRPRDRCSHAHARPDTLLGAHTPPCAVACARAAVASGVRFASRAEAYIRIKEHAAKLGKIVRVDNKGGRNLRAQCTDGKCIFCVVVGRPRSRQASHGGYSEAAQGSDDPAADPTGLADGQALVEVLEYAGHTCEGAAAVRCAICGLAVGDIRTRHAATTPRAL